QDLYVCRELNRRQLAIPYWAGTPIQREDHFRNILWPRSPRESKYAARSRISSSLNVSSSPVGIIDTFDFSTDSTRLWLTFTRPFGSSIFVITDMASPL